ncbi:NAD-dependent dehydratase [Shewanella baltica]|uniref:NAD-dependent epimerase/dehydratase n=1 Tax=Shewanella baltica (strain OS195) TaxID=399599 RepID=A9KWU2_SHEB9|nr:NAD-dependent 4,6-dehydratase LegB [Shewanella baltica]ABX50279.1 NAD-dependent epimerase/dehydratase [Shewanella baltica OS195]ADT95265.1 NAD-dependent epimerase/dehydratase [Shewanella baltica OS678]EHC06400.1 dTDP-glucose 4,6-dehydratase [Shewanella baltica OS625]KZK65107.1 NAD-dependent dehydratase [Shewanella baltica]SUI47589.1 dTDP-glucose 4,6-dehydratase [Shewanella baltica]
MKKVLVTGADGFIGSHLVEMLVAQGYQVRALSQYNSFNYWGWLENIDCLDEVEVICGDIRDPHFCKHLCKDIDVIYHLAALIAIPYSYIAPDSYLDTNAKGTLNICQAALENNVSRVIHTSTSEVYGTAKYVPIDEQHPLQPQSPYSASKMAADAMAMSFHNSFELPLTIARPFNTYGPRQSARAVIPTIISQIAAGATQIKLGDISPTRDFNYVLDTCRGFIALAAHDNCIGETLNISSNYEISIEDTLNIIKQNMHSDVEFITDDARLRPQQSEVFRLWGDNSKIKTLTGYQPQFDIHIGLKETITWFTEPANLSKYKSTIYNR